MTPQEGFPDRFLMKILTNQNFPRLLSATTDGVALYLFQKWKNGILVSIVDPLTLISVTRFNLPIDLRVGIEPIVSDHICLYTNQSEMVIIDKFSGELLRSIDLGFNLLISTPYIFQNYIYSLCFTPISVGIKTDVDNSCICINEINTGQRLYQTQTMLGRANSLGFYDGPWCAVGNALLGYDIYGEKKYSQDLTFKADHKPVIDSAYIIASSTTGAIMIQSKSDRAQYFCQKNQVCPIIINDEVIWICDENVFKITGKNEIRKVLDKKNSNCAVVRKNVIIFDSESNIICLNCQTDEYTTLNIGLPVTNIIPINDLLIVVSGDNISTVR